ncbi:transporter [Novosphingobium flavum]|uniref:Transporter n=1 Tax=Novosphingobium flavum TaxID=1778672 RepID=A0A7X1FVR3_9SPHN|nr:transporter [Novosphingobium flavum]MBC2667267.1 transporter [Novosphingobium flavum]
MRNAILSGLLAMACTAPAHAEEREFCASRPGLGTPSCTMAPGTAMVEVGGIEWDGAADAGGRTDSLTFGDLGLRVGLDERTEVQVGYTAFTRQRSRDGSDVAVARGSGDAMIGLRRGLAGPNGPVAVQAFVTLPVGRGVGTAGDWGAGLRVPAALTLPQGFEIDLTPEADAAVNQSGEGRHLAYGGVIGLAHAVAPRLSGELELAAFRDDDPAGHSTDARIAASLAWMVRPGLQLDAEYDRGLSQGAPDNAVALGFAFRL